MGDGVLGHEWRNDEHRIAAVVGGARAMFQLRKRQEAKAWAHELLGFRIGYGDDVMPAIAVVWLASIVPRRLSLKPVASSA